MANRQNSRNLKPKFRQIAGEYYSLAMSNGEVAPRPSYAYSLVTTAREATSESGTLDANNPDSEESIEWIAENAVNFVVAVKVMYMSLTAKNKKWDSLCQRAQDDKTLGYPPHVKFLSVTAPGGEPELMPVNEYVEKIILWSETVVQDESIFPRDEDVPFPDDFLDMVTRLHKRLVRIYAIMLCNRCLASRSSDAVSLENSFEHFMFFSWKWGLLEMKDTRYMREICLPLKEKYDRDEGIEKFGFVPAKSQLRRFKI